MEMHKVMLQVSDEIDNFKATSSTSNSKVFKKRPQIKIL